MKKIGVIGLGKVGALVAVLLNQSFEVKGFDKVVKGSFSFATADLEVTDLQALRAALQGFDAVVACLPYQYNLAVARVAYESGLHYFDLTEDVNTTAEIIEMSKISKTLMAPQCGLAPGFIGIVGYHLIQKFTKLRDVELRVGALPRYPNGLLGYSFNWSPAGVVNEYLNDAEIIENGKRKFMPSLTGVETINIEGQEYEAFTTSGGLGTLCKTLEGRVDTLNYKTIRYPGHNKLMRFLLFELLLKDKRTLVEEILTQAKPPVKEDLVHVYAVVEGWKEKAIFREEFFQTYLPQTIDGQTYRAISWTTAAAVCSVVELVQQERLKNQGFLKQEDINLEDFLATSYGQLYRNQMG